jgi:hypothetical protein
MSLEALLVKINKNSDLIDIKDIPVPFYQIL